MSLPTAAMDGIAWHEYRTPGRLRVAADGACQFVVAGDDGPTLTVDGQGVQLPLGFDETADVAVLGRGTQTTHLLTHALKRAVVHEGEGGGILAKAIGTVTAMLYTDTGERVWVLDCGFTLLYVPAPGAYIAAGRAGEWFEVRFDAPLELWQVAHDDTVLDRQVPADADRPAEATR